MGGHALEALRDVSLNIGKGEFVSIMGPSGSGKSTLMNIIGCLDTPSGGEYYLEGRNVAGLSFDQLASIRNRMLGFVFQNFNLLPYATAWENVELPLLFNGKNAKKRRERVTELLRAVGLFDWKEHRPSELSGGSSSVSPWPGPWPTIRPLSWPTSRRETSIPTAARRSWASSENYGRKGGRSSWSPTTIGLPPTPSAPSAFSTAKSLKYSQNRIFGRPSFVFEWLYRSLRRRGPCFSCRIQRLGPA